MKADRRSRQRIVVLASTLLALPFLLGQGCPVYDGGARFIGGAAAPTVAIHSPTLNRTASIGELITLVYDAVGGGTVLVSAFYDRDGLANTGDEVTFGSGLASGTNKFTQLATSSLAEGPLYLGITATNSSGTTTAYAGGVITLVGTPSMSFLSPAGDMRVGIGTQVTVQIQTSLTNYSYSVFYDMDGVLDGDEITVDGGSNSTSSMIEATLDSSELSVGTYYVGVTVTTSASLSVTAYANGTVTVVAGAFIQVLSPTVGMMVQPGEYVQIRWDANDADQPSAMVRLFYDLDNIFGNGNDTYITQLPQTATGWSWDTNGVAIGNYYIGAELQNGMTPPLHSYSAGPVMVGAVDQDTGDSTLNVTTPLVPVTMLAGTTYRINWRTSLKSGEGVVTVFWDQDLDDDGEADGKDDDDGDVIAEGLDANIQYVDLDTSGMVGEFFIGAILTIADTQETVTDYAEGTITVIPKTFWVGALDTEYDEDGLEVHQTGPFQGATFCGHNFGDNLGSAMVMADDYDGDRRNEIILGAQFGKPFFARDGGRGAGEAYMIYGTGQRYEGNYHVNNVGQASMPGVIFTGIIPNPYQGGDPDAGDMALAGRSIPYNVEGLPAEAYATEGLRSITLIPDQDNDGKQEIVFGFPYCNSFSLWYQSSIGMTPAPLVSMGRLENNGHFLRGGIVMVSSTNPLINNRTSLSRHFDRILQLHEVGQLFSQMRLLVADDLPTHELNCPENEPLFGDDGDTVLYPYDGFFQNTLTQIDPPRLAGVEQAGMWALGRMHMGSPFYPYGCPTIVLLDQIDPPADAADIELIGGRFMTSSEDCEPPLGPWPDHGFLAILGTGFYSTGDRVSNRVFADARAPYGCRILGQTTSQCPSPPNCISTADRFGYSVSVSGDYLLIGAPTRTARSSDVPMLPTASRRKSGTVYMLQLKTEGASDRQFMYSAPQDGQLVANYDLPAPHNYIIEDLGYTRMAGTECSVAVVGPGDASFEMTRPTHIVGARPDDQVGNVTGLYDINNDGVDDLAVGAPGAFRLPFESSPRGAVYVLYRRQSEIENHYLLEDLERDPVTDPDRLNGLVITGAPGETLGQSIDGGGPLNDDYNDDGFADLLIGCPDASTANGIHSGEVFILFGGRNLLNPAGGTTIDELRTAGDGMLIIGACAGDRMGMTVANAGDFNGDGIPDLLIAAPDASPRFDDNDDGLIDINDPIGLDLNGDGDADDLNEDGDPDDMTGAGVVYVVFGGEHLTGTISLGLIGSEYLPGITIAGRKGGDPDNIDPLGRDSLGGGLTQNGLLSRGVSPAGDVDGDGRADLLISSVLADPEDKTNAGEVYLIYGFRP